MDASSVTEEDIIEICITMGHIHPLGVLHYSATESVVLFCCEGAKIDVLV